ncbi:glycosyltransferase family 39 protein [Candidatus Woesearchaeota archaeon]|nr:glycosyltransferase family 39 protein [Candidatus Woesearchaeota archaeon]
MDEVTGQETKAATNNKLSKWQQKFSDFFKDKSNFIVVLVIGIGILIRLYYLFLAANQPLWWDEAELMLQAKHIAFNIPNTGWFPYREPLLPIIWGLFFNLGANEFFIRFIEFLFSTAAVIFTYLLSKEIFDKKTAIIATSFLAVFYLHLFYSLRFMAEAPTLAFVTMAVYYFWIGYVKSINLRYLIISALSIAIGFLSYYAVIFIGIVITLFLVITERFKFLKVKKLWVATLAFVLLLLPYIIYSMKTLHVPLPRLYAVQTSIAQVTKVYSAWSFYLKLFPTYLQTVLLLVFLAGVLYVLINLILGFDLMLKNKNEELKKYLFLVLWIIIPIIILSYIAVNQAGHAEDRYIILIFPAVFLVASISLIKTSDYIKKLNLKLAVAFIVLAIVIVGLQQLKQADSLIKSRLTSYDTIKEAGLWIKQHSNPRDTVISNSIPQNTYYSGRATYYEYEEEKINSRNPRYFVVSIFENSGEAYFKYPEQHQSSMVPVQAYFADEEKKQVMLVIYEFRSNQS